MNLTAYLTGVNAIIVLDGVATAVLGLVIQPFSCVVHAIPAARSERDVHDFQQCWESSYSTQTSSNFTSQILKLASSVHSS